MSEPNPVHVTKCCEAPMVYEEKPDGWRAARCSKCKTWNPVELSKAEKERLAMKMFVSVLNRE